MINRQSPWLPSVTTTVRPVARIFCFGHAGSNAMIYSRWQRLISSDMQICPVVLPGRGPRLREPPSEDLLQLAFEAAAAISGCNDVPFAFFGHSMGAVIGFEVLRCLEADYGSIAAHLFVAGSSAPHVRRNQPATTAFDGDILNFVREINGTPSDLIDNPEAMELFLPALKADLAALQGYTCADGITISCPITAFAGSEDKYVDPLSVNAWRAHTARFLPFLVPGDHFSMLRDPKLILSRISSELSHHVLKTSRP